MYLFPNNSTKNVQNQWAQVHLTLLMLSLVFWGALEGWNGEFYKNGKQADGYILGNHLAVVKETSILRVLFKLGYDQ